MDHQPHASRLRGIHSWNIAPDITLDVDSINKNRVGMRYYRGRLGYFYDKIEDFEALPGDTSRLGQFDLDWRAELPEMQTLDRDLCGDCRDDGGGSRLRDFIHYCNVAEWDQEYWMLSSTLSVRRRAFNIVSGSRRLIAAIPTTCAPMPLETSAHGCRITPPQRAAGV